MRVKNPKVRDAGRVPRVVGTRRRVSVMVEAFTTARKARPFDELANRILPYTRTELRDLRVQKALRKEQKPLRTLPEGLPRLSMGGPPDRSPGSQGAQVVRAADARLRPGSTWSGTAWL
jgi:hypothetical protein